MKRIMMNEDGKAELYDNTWDVTIHCTSEEEHKRVIKMLQDATS